MRIVTLEQAQDRYHTHTRRTLNDAALALAAQSKAWDLENGTPRLMLGGRLAIHFHCDSYGNVYGSVDPKARA